MSNARWIGFQGVIGGVSVVAALLAAGCTNQPAPEVPTAEVPPAPSASPSAEASPDAPPIEITETPKKKAASPVDGAGSDKENPVMRCGPGDSYVFVSAYECKDGTRPLGGDPRAGGAARKGNVGANSKGHIIDLYVIPCSDGPVEVYVDMYGCPEYEQMLIGN